MACLVSIRVKKPSQKATQGKRNSHRRPHSVAAVTKREQPPSNSPVPPSDISPAIAFLLCLKASPAHTPARRPSTRLTSRAVAIAQDTTAQEDRATLALLTLPILLMICGLAITQSLKPIRRVDLAAAPATVIPPAAIAPKPIPAPSTTLKIPAIPASPSPQVSDLAAIHPPLAPVLPSDLIPATASPPPSTATSPATTAANERTAMLTTRPPVELEPAAPLVPPIASHEASLEPKLCTAQPANPPADLTSAALAPAAFGLALAAAARAQTRDLVIYNDKYRVLSYPRGDVQPLYGVCTDVIIRAYRALGVDLQQLVHETRVGNSDTSIDHRRTETLRRFFARFGQQLPASSIAEDYVPGDIVTYDRPQNRGSRSHIAVVSSVVAPSGRYMIVHNRGWGPQLEDGLFVDAITGHYRYTPLAAAPVLANIPVISTPQKRQPSLTRLALRSHRRLDGLSVNGLGR